MRGKAKADLAAALMEAASATHTAIKRQVAALRRELQEAAVVQLAAM